MWWRCGSRKEPGMRSEETVSSSRSLRPVITVFPSSSALRGCRSAVDRTRIPLARSMIYCLLFIPTPMERLPFSTQRNCVALLIHGVERVRACISGRSGRVSFLSRVFAFPEGFLSFVSLRHGNSTFNDDSVHEESWMGQQGRLCGRRSPSYAALTSPPTPCALRRARRHATIRICKSAEGALPQSPANVGSKDCIKYL
ncbi:hypothetical protein C8R45DRAFT_1040258 [Mycena sanguinolenta]|nr:hypothetical protein C8R45DRAFT_1040258 [Mycena sanguinolenta]